MVTDEKILSTAWFRYRLGNGLIWLGVLVWLPFILLRLAGERPSLILYLPLHLAGVLGGSRLRAVARRDMNLPTPRRNILQVLGHILILAGILVWAPYFYLKVVLHRGVDVMDFLPYHLAGVSVGITFLAIRYLMARRETITDI